MVNDSEQQWAANEGHKNSTRPAGAHSEDADAASASENADGDGEGDGDGHEAGERTWRAGGPRARAARASWSPRSRAPAPRPSDCGAPLPTPGLRRSERPITTPVQFNSTSSRKRTYLQIALSYVVHICSLYATTRYGQSLGANRDRNAIASQFKVEVEVQAAEDQPLSVSESTPARRLCMSQVIGVGKMADVSEREWHVKSVESSAPEEWQSESSGRQRTAGGRRTAGATGQSRYAVDGLLVRAVRPAGAQPAKHREQTHVLERLLFSAQDVQVQSESTGGEGRGQREVWVQCRVAHRARRASCRSFGHTHLSSMRPLSDVALPQQPFAFEALDMADELQLLGVGR